MITILILRWNTQLVCPWGSFEVGEESHIKDSAELRGFIKNGWVTLLDEVVIEDTSR